MSIFSQINLELFHLFNVQPDSSAFLIQFGLFIAHDLIYILCFAFTLSWFFCHDQAKKYLIKAVIFISIALLCSQILSFLFAQPRPFVVGIGKTILAHATTGSFPSNHMTILSALAFSYWFSPYKKWAIYLFILAWLVAWSRVFVGVHFPIDMLGGFILAFLINFFGLSIWQRYENQITQPILTYWSKLKK